MRLLSVIIPSYNTELYLARCLDSLLYNEDVVDLLDIIIVNDGSKDGTSEIAHKYQAKYPDSITVIDKENGGHGSTINAGLEVARGKYVKVIDSDDWVNIFDFGKFVKELEDLDDDIIVTNFSQIVLYDDTSTEINFYHGNNDSRPIEDVEEIMSTDGENYTFSMHSMTIKTASLKDVWEDGLLENTFYVDMQFVTKVLECAKSFRTLNYMIYMYFIGRPEQSVADFFKRRANHERVLTWILAELHSDTVKSKDYLYAALLKLSETMVRTHYEAYYQTFTATQDEVNELLRFNELLIEKYPDLHKEIPAAQNVKHRLSVTRRFIKRKTLVS